MAKWFFAGLLLAALLSLGACAQPAQLVGTDLGMEPAPDFGLADQDGRPVSLQDLRGRVVVLTFLYTNCPDVCPLIASRLRTASQELGSAMDQVALVAVSLDPERDTPQAIRAFNEKHQLQGKLRFVSGERAQLEPIWAAYFIGAEADPTHPELIAHSSRVVVIDKAGNQRVNLSSDFDPADLVHNVRALLNE